MTARCSWVTRAACCNWKKRLAAALQRRRFPAPCALEPSKKLPLALYRDHSVSRDAALIALRDSELVWQIVYTSPSLTGVRAAALAGLAITPLPASAIIAGLRVLGVESGLPLLPDLEFAIFERKRPDAAAAALTAVLVALGQTAVRPTAG